MPLLGHGKLRNQPCAVSLPSEQYQIDCIAPFESSITQALRDTGCSVFITPIADDPFWQSIQLTTEVVRQQKKVDLIHAHMPKAHVLAGLVGALTHIPVVATVHGMSLSTLELSIQRIADSQLIAVCQAAYMQAMALGVSQEKVTFISNGVNTRRFSP